VDDPQFDCADVRLEEQMNTSKAKQKESAEFIKRLVLVVIES
jgi:hypothetical protein